MEKLRIDRYLREKVTTYNLDFGSVDDGRVSSKTGQSFTGDGRISSKDGQSFTAHMIKKLNNADKNNYSENNNDSNYNNKNDNKNNNKSNIKNEYFINKFSDLGPKDTFKFQSAQLLSPFLSHTTTAQSSSQALPLSLPHYPPDSLPLSLPQSLSLPTLSRQPSYAESEPGYYTESSGEDSICGLLSLSIATKSNFFYFFVQLIGPTFFETFFNSSRTLRDR